MSGWIEIETGMVSALQALTEGGRPLLATVSGYALRERRGLYAAIGRERMPAAYVMAGGRGRSEGEPPRPGAVEATVLIAQRNERVDSEARIGGVDTVGLFTLAERVACAVHELRVGHDRLALLLDEAAVGGEAGLQLWEQRYEVRYGSAWAAPLFDGAALAGVESRVHVDVGELRVAVSAFSFPGVDGVFERVQGARERTITWRGQLRAASAAALNAIEADIEESVRSGRPAVMTDECGREFFPCAARAFKRRGRRGGDELNGRVIQDFELIFVQLG